MWVILPYIYPFCISNHVFIGKMSSYIFNPDSSEGLKKKTHKKNPPHTDVFVSVLTWEEFSLFLLIVILFDLSACLSQLCSFSEVASLLAIATVLHFMPLPSRNPGYCKGTLCIFKFPVAKIEHSLLDTQLQSMQIWFKT